MATENLISNDLFSRFQTQLKAAGGEAHLVEGLPQAAQLIASHPALSEGELIIPPHFLKHPSFGSILARLTDAGIHLREADTAANIADAPAGLSGAELAVAETGSVLLADNALESRIVGMLTLTHFVLVQSSALVPLLDDVGEVLRRLSMDKTNQQHYLSMVTGPSRTADIERTLTIGVQGPKVLSVICIASENMGGNV
jgi:L-lactate dehydrogenase complex protein LldG